MDNKAPFLSLPTALSDQSLASPNSPQAANESVQNFNDEEKLLNFDEFLYERIEEFLDEEGLFTSSPTSFSSEKKFTPLISLKKMPLKVLPLNILKLNNTTRSKTDTSAHCFEKDIPYKDKDDQPLPSIIARRQSSEAFTSLLTKE